MKNAIQCAKLKVIAEFLLSLSERSTPMFEEAHPPPTHPRTQTHDFHERMPVFQI
jgi:hypothetical protein